LFALQAAAMQLARILASGSLFAGAALATLHTVKVGSNGNNFDPNSLQADVGDVVQFVFSSAVCPSSPVPPAEGIAPATKDMQWD